MGDGRWTMDDRRHSCVELPISRAEPPIAADKSLIQSAWLSSAADKLPIWRAWLSIAADKSLIRYLDLPIWRAEVSIAIDKLPISRAWLSIAADKSLIRYVDLPIWRAELPSWRAWLSIAADELPSWRVELLISRAWPPLSFVNHSWLLRPIVLLAGHGSADRAGGRQDVRALDMRRVYR
jgi:hypothetical protein